MRRPFLIIMEVDMELPREDFDCDDAAGYISGIVNEGLDPQDSLDHIAAYALKEDE